MKLHEFKDEFRELISIVAANKHLPEQAIERDYYIVLLLKNLADSQYAEQCVFKGGTSLSKCYPGSIERFSEDIDLTFLGIDLPEKERSKKIKKIEDIMTVGADTEKIPSEGSNISKSMYVWFGAKSNRVKLEIGSSIRPDLYDKKMLKSYIQEFLEENQAMDDIQKFCLQTVTLNVLDITRTFIDKLMSVKRHAICGSIEQKVRHIYDVVRLYHLPEIKEFLQDTAELKRLLRLTKETDSYYLNKRDISKEYNPLGAYDFESWKHYFSGQVKAIYESMHNDLLYTDEKQNFDEAVETFAEINKIFEGIGE